MKSFAISGVRDDDYDLSKNELIKRITITSYSSSQIYLHLHCEEGDEQKLADSLPYFIHENYCINAAFMQVLITRKNNS